MRRTCSIANRGRDASSPSAKCKWSIRTHESRMRSPLLQCGRSVPSVRPQSCVPPELEPQLGLSVDIDLTYLPVHDRQKSLEKIDASLKRIAAAIHSGIPNAHVQMSKLKKERSVNKLTTQTQNAQVKIEVTPVLRGCAYDPDVRRVTEADLAVALDGHAVVGVGKVLTRYPEVEGPVGGLL